MGIRSVAQRAVVLDLCMDAVGRREPRPDSSSAAYVFAATLMHGNRYCQLEPPR